MISSFEGSAPTNALLSRIRAGSVGGVILFAGNVASGEQATRELIAALQEAAVQGGNPPLLIMTDQEGGEVKRLTWAPPALAPSQMTSGSLARAEGEATGRALKAVGVNVDLAPVADVERAVGSFLHTRAFGSSQDEVGERACSFARGVASQGVAFTLKHFPGLGRALASTDTQPVTIEASSAAIREDYVPYVECGGEPDALVMVNSASYPSLTGNDTPAVMSPEIYSQELRVATGTTPLTISDDLQAGALAHETTPAERAINAGLDLLMYAQTEEGSANAYQELLGIVQSGGIMASRIESAYSAIEAMKERVAGAKPAAATAGSGEGAYPGNISAPETIKPEQGAG